ncbi:MAG: GNAT family N-acetyltransferase [Rhodoglobus sp.]|nr:GNAT family N-acetyltransferase [Rhodoglobus sp.]
MHNECERRDRTRPATGRRAAARRQRGVRAVAVPGRQLLPPRHLRARGARGRGLAGALLRAVEDRAREQGCTLARLETGPKSVAAIALYEKHGYRRIPNFGQYEGDPHSYCMEKAL